MKEFKWMVLTAISLVLFYFVAFKATELQHQLDNARSERVKLQQELNRSKSANDVMSKQIEKLKHDIKKTHEETNRLKRILGEPIQMNVSAYSASFRNTGKNRGSRGYGRTASGRIVRRWETIAAPKNIPFGTKIYIPYFKDKPNHGIFIVQDRGGAIKKNKLDVYTLTDREAFIIGRRHIPVYILNYRRR